ncbi:MAG: TraV family lipoprotein, partial [Desulfurococcaceae archaeon]
SLFGCGAVFNPYESQFECPQAEKGKCVGIPEAYRESLSSSANGTYNVYEEIYGKRGETLLTPAEERYIEALYQKLTSLLKEPNTPVVVPPKIVRVLILPYSEESNKALYSSRYIFVLVDEPKWVLHNIIQQLNAPEE